MSKTEVLRLLRKARNTDPDAFETAVREYSKWGAGALEPPRPPGRPRVITDEVLARLLLVARWHDEAVESYRLKGPRDIESPFKWQTSGGEWREWRTSTSIRQHLFEARKRYDDDESFRALVERMDKQADEGWEPTAEELSEFENMLHERT